MTGPEHYKEAERLLRAQTKPSSVPGYGPVISAGADPEVIAVAQVHATLALAAATAFAAGLITGEWPDWCDAASARPQAEPASHEGGAA